MRRGKKSRQPQEAPTWLRFENYARVEGLSDYDWCCQINVRQVCFTLLPQEPFGITLESDSNSRLCRALSCLQSKNPVCNRDQEPFNQSPFKQCFQLELGESPVVRGMNRDDLRLFSQLHPTLLEATRESNSSLDADALESGIIMIPVVIDIGFSNETLVAHFAEYVRNMRRDPRAAIPEYKKKTPDVTEWAKLGVLQCMDLLLWAKQMDREISHEEIADALSRLVGPEQIRRTTRPLAERLLRLGWRDSPLYSRLKARAGLDQRQRLSIREVKRRGKEGKKR